MMIVTAGHPALVLVEEEPGTELADNVMGVVSVVLLGLRMNLAMKSVTMATTSLMALVTALLTKQGIVAKVRLDLLLFFFSH